MPQRILVVDDEDDIIDLLRYNLEKEGFEVTQACDGVEAVLSASQHVPDLIILDVMMPRMDGLEACRRMREHPALKNTPIVMLTARSEENNHVQGLDGGADIYLTKPISIPVLMSQVKASLRSADGSSDRSAEHASGTPHLVRIYGLTIDRSRYVVDVEGQEDPLHLPRKEFELLRFLAGNPGRVYSRQQLLDEVWGLDVFVVDRTVDVHIRKIREKVGEDMIETVKGVGYRFRA
ncbi:MAG: two-component system alkaline phosphatase synthesis response regulator PhoP [Rhodothermales bacterium]|jgi:two-component system alkaline phosphatase synthesis response regulator PhoP